MFNYAAKRRRRCPKVIGAPPPLTKIGTNAAADCAWVGAAPCLRLPVVKTQIDIMTLSFAPEVQVYSSDIKTSVTSRCNYR